MAVREGNQWTFWLKFDILLWPLFRNHRKCQPAHRLHHGGGGMCRASPEPRHKGPQAGHKALHICMFWLHMQQFGISCAGTLVITNTIELRVLTCLRSISSTLV